MLPNYYSILSVGRNASQDDIKSAFKKLALKHHPDRNPNDKTAEEIFKRINEAYQVLSDTEKRKNYDLKLDYESYSRRTSTPHSNPSPSNYHQSTFRPGVNQQTAGKAKTSGYKRPSPEYMRKEEGKKWLFIATFFLVIGTGGFFFMMGMNSLAATQHYDQAKELFDGELYKEAYMQLQESLHFDQKHSPSYALRSKLRIILFDDAKGAIFDLGKAIQYSEEPSASLLYERGMLLAGAERNKEALADLEAAFALTPQADSLLFPIAKIRAFKISDYTGGIQAYDQYLKLHPENGDAWFGKAFAKLQMGDFSNSIEDFDKSIQLNNPAESHFYKAKALLALNKQGEACAELKIASDMDLAEAVILAKEVCPIP
ncbi:MAG: DnaJ domain-containing protein, partial [Cytophagales bacterium]|nr:DnaJ domain-containing protein [Cytophagales bacterium]